MFVPAVLHGLAQGSADLAHQRQVCRQWLVQPLQHHDALAALEYPAELRPGKGPEHGQVDHTHLQATGLAQVIRHHLGAGNQAALADDQVIGILHQVGGHRPVLATGQLVKFIERLFRQFADMVEEERPLGRHTLHVGILVLHQARHQRVVHIPQLGDTPTHIPKNHALGRGGRGDDVVRSTQVFGDHLPLGHLQ